MSRKKVAEEAVQVPLWIITFSDMTTSLLTFFVLLLSMGQMRDETLFDHGQALTFLESVKVGFGFRKGVDFGELKIRHYIPPPNELPDGRNIDAKGEEISQILSELSRSMNTLPPVIYSQKTNFIVTDIHFTPGQTNLDDAASKFLKEFCRDLNLGIDGKPGMLYVLGLAPDEKTEREQWLLSAQRAEAVAGFLRDNLNLAGDLQKRPDLFETPPRWSVYSWGAGPGGDWVGPDSLMSQRSQILIAVLR